MTGWKKLAVVALVALGWLAGLGIMALAGGGRSSLQPEAALLEALPSAWSAGRYMGYERFTADELNRRPPRESTGLRFVGPDRPSTEPAVVSVHPIDHYTWGAASGGGGECVVLVSVDQPDDPQYGTTRYGVLPAGTPCTGSNATTATATLDDLPYDDPPPGVAEVVAEVLFGVASLGVPLALLALVVVRARRQRPLLVLRNLAITVAATIVWWLALIGIVGALGASWREFGWSNYYGGFCWGLAGGLIVLIGVMSALAVDRASPEARAGFAALGTGVVALPLAFMVLMATII
ncbi:MAG TPA: hypothetical protein VFJ85_03125 [Acidimicrobiales bacterium]|nr:hypothetical protein [Acidimicrobiales bacterium]